MRRLSICVATVVFAAAESAAGAAATFSALGDFSPEGISADGSVVVGHMRTDAGPIQAVRWTASSGIVSLGAFPSGNGTSEAFDVSADGSVVVGYSHTWSGNQAFRWTAGGGMVGLGDLPGGDFSSYAEGVSADGSVVVGRSNSGSGLEAFRWTSGDGMVGLGDLAGGPFSSQAYAVSADGATVTGGSVTSAAPESEAFVWTAEGGMTSIDDVPGSDDSGYAQAISADGSVVVGYGTGAGGWEAFRWTASGGVIGLGDLSGANDESFAYDVSGDGSVVVGRGTTDSGLAPFLWDELHGMRDLGAVLESLGADLTGWDLTSANAVSADGRTIVGYGTNPDGDVEAWMARFETNPAIPVATAIAAGAEHTCVITTGLPCWGGNDSGQLGDGTTVQRSNPQYVPGLNGGVDAVATGKSHTCAIKSDGGLQCWGANGDGRLGDGTTISRSTPVDVAGLTSGVVAVAAGEFHTCAVTDAGGVKCWGRNQEGQLGNGVTSVDPELTPVDVVGLTGGVVAIAAGSWHTCALLATGGVKCWGDNYWGQLGNGTTQDLPIPADVLGLAGVTAISAGAMYNCAITDIPSAGGLQCWGYNGLGQLGDGTTMDRHTPVSVSGLGSGVANVSGSINHTCAVTDAGSVQCWGSNLYGQLGDGTTTSRDVPADVLGLSSGASAVGAGGLHTCAITLYGVLCWGSNSEGQLGNDLALVHDTPVAVVPEPAFLGSIAAGVALLVALARRAASRLPRNLATSVTVA